jgi:hypothetical protein
LIYRVAILLGCDLISDPEAFIARKILERIFSIPSDIQRKLEKHQMQNCIISSIIFYVDALLDQERFPLETTPLFNLQLEIFTSCFQSQQLFATSVLMNSKENQMSIKLFV